jgi:hypothetical protein
MGTVVLGAPKLEWPRGIFPTPLYGQSAPGWEEAKNAKPKRTLQYFDVNSIFNVVVIDARVLLHTNEKRKAYCCVFAVNKENLHQRKNNKH